MADQSATITVDGKRLYWPCLTRSGMIKLRKAELIEILAAIRTATGKRARSIDAGKAAIMDAIEAEKRAYWEARGQTYDDAPAQAAEEVSPKDRIHAGPSRTGEQLQRLGSTADEANAWLATLPMPPYREMRRPPMTKHDLMTIDAAAAELGVPRASLRTAAEQHGYLVRMGRAIRIEKASLGELIQKCRDQQKAHASTNSRTARTGISETPDAQINQRAVSAAQKLKKPSPPTSRQRGATVLPLNHTR
ncbi:hypothetical protein C8J27_106259 [Rhodobacter aestuarii]|uniref:Uncharacterized protein n=1 Tax=Rhodobacter aestuarii TaxID=453582 RepID=A0A1N7MC76_9RHOB|nr:hypothetical protein [Rhodobacter aestuarii]PTV94989.1 hypothetical protein C8J27_106259 [Rhodobacter aestuarii]SIS83715.1 hypothetical protein SAMN05421580_105259 [Rhodobacter aestuarii]